MTVFPDSLIDNADWSPAPCIKVDPDIFFPDLGGNAANSQVRAAHPSGSRSNDAARPGHVRAGAVE